MNKKNDEYWMNQAIQLAYLSEIVGEIPIGSILILNNKIIGCGRNNSISKNDPTGHAEIIALRQGGKFLNNYRLLNTTLYVTLEPCLMCFSAIFLSRISNLVYGAHDNSNNKCCFKQHLLKHIFVNSSLKIKSGILELKCSTMIKKFFHKKRKKNLLNQL
ncbi:tRNA-specific adenosine deaminase [Buchnera aphidicola (Eriosoma lanigerum)]|uniref:tRNA adenosine(34) deaminase TadA n=1 Tax=Buchnera aphidicola TaxID=9 RepID=UPI0034642202